MPQDGKVQPLRPASAIEPAANSLRHIFVRDLAGSCFLGVHSHEKGSRQRVRINLDLGVVDDGPPPDDHIDQVVCYEEIVAGVRELLDGPHINLVETLAENIAAFCLRDPRVVVVKVRVEKLDVFDDTAAVGVEIERVRRIS